MTQGGAAKPSDQAPVKDQGKAPQSGEGGGDEEQAKAGWGRWLFGWLVVPGLVIAAIFLAGVYLGANHPDNWYTRAVVWVVDLF